jgi:hypothetical protein
VPPAQGSSGTGTCPMGSSTHLPGAGQDSSRGATCHRLEPAPGPACVSWAPAPASRRRTAPGARRVPAAPGRRKNIGPSSSETKLRTIFFSIRRPAQGSSGGSACPRGSGPNENRRADAEDLAEPGRCKATPIRSKQNRAQRIDSDPICVGPAVADRKAAAARLRDSDGGGRVAPRRGEEEETPVEARTSDDEDRRQNRSDQRRSED